MNVLTEDGVPATLTEAEQTLWRAAHDRCGWPSTGAWAVMPDKRPGADIAGRVVVECLSGVKDSQAPAVAYCDSAVAEYLELVQPAAVLALLSEVARLRLAGGADRRVVDGREQAIAAAVSR